MSDIVIRVENLSKKYTIRHANSRAAGEGLRHTLQHAATAPFRALRSSFRPPTSDLRPQNSSSKEEEFYALHDVSFKVRRGEVLGIIGRNGAGKSTLLKILSRITEPTSGRIGIKGRVASLLEVGTGFHPELTGCENIFLNGAILGMSRAEVKRKFDEIVAFAEVEKFLDTPVKHYSSGMYVRLAFAVAAHLEPEILIVDEVLAVGDAEFQKKCLGKMSDVARKEGRTVLFVSHNMQAVSSLCPTALLLVMGKLALNNTSSRVMREYISSEKVLKGEAVWKFETAPGTDAVRLHAVRSLNNEGVVCCDFDTDSNITLKVDFWILKKTKMTISIHLYNQQRVILFASPNWNDKIWGQATYDIGMYSCWCSIPERLLNEGDHFVKLYLTRDNNASLIDVEISDVISFAIHDSGTTRKGFMGEWLGAARPILDWNGLQITNRF